MNEKIPIGVVGLGLMGSSITTCLLAAGHPVTALDKNIASFAGTTARIAQYLEQLHCEGLLEEVPAVVMKRLLITNEYASFAGYEVVIESVTEDVDQKRFVFEELERVLSPTAIIGSNTSAIPVSSLQERLGNPARLLGIHWGEPAHVLRFMEVICGDATDLTYAGKIMDLAAGWGKEPSLIKKDIRGFITNRLMYAMLREAVHLVENDYATIEDIDRACRNDMGYWITFAGLFRFMDLTGIPAYLAVMKDLFPTLDNSSNVPGFIEALVSSGAKGVSNNRGFYSYTKESALKWEKLFMEFSYEIRKLADKYPYNAGDV